MSPHSLEESKLLTPYVCFCIIQMFEMNLPLSFFFLWFFAYTGIPSLKYYQESMTSQLLILPGLSNRFVHVSNRY